VNDSPPKTSMLRLQKLLETLRQQGTTQKEIAERANIPASYLADMKNGHRAVTELFARRLAAEFDIDHQWLLGGVGTMDSIETGSEGVIEGSGSLWLPVFIDPIEGPPLIHRAWNGSSIEIAGAAAARVRLADSPYILRYGQDDGSFDNDAELLGHEVKKGRLRCGDLLLISQSCNETAEFQVVKTSPSTAYLMRATIRGTWQRVADGREYQGQRVIGHCIGLVWAAFS
jgi:transcriptional regulator with XRE-family HTH domain